MLIWHKKTGYVFLSLILNETDGRDDCFMMYKLRDLREDKDLKQMDLAELLNCSQPCYSRYEKGGRDIPTNVLCQLAEFYNISVDYILGRTDEKKPYPEAKHSK